MISGRMRIVRPSVVEWTVPDFQKVVEKMTPTETVQSPTLIACGHRMYWTLSLRSGGVTLRVCFPKSAPDWSFEWCVVGVAEELRNATEMNSANATYEFDFMSGEFLQQSRWFPKGTLCLEGRIAPRPRQHSVRHSDNLRRLFETGDDADCHFVVRDRLFRVHQCILRCQIPAFRGVRFPSMEVCDCDPGAFREFLLHAYCGRVDNLSSDNVLEVYKTARQFDAEILSKLCRQIFASNRDAVLETPEWEAFQKEYPDRAEELVGYEKKADLKKGSVKEKSL